MGAQAIGSSELIGAARPTERRPTLAQAPHWPTSGWGGGTPPPSSLPRPARGGRYRLCWCSTVAAVCDAAPGFAVDFGELFVRGPPGRRDGPQDRTCVSGRACIVEGLEVFGASAEDRLYVMDTRGP